MAGIRAGIAYVDILPNLKGFGTALTAGVTQQQKDVASKVGKIGLVAGAAVALGAKVAIDQAKNLNEAVSAVSVTFASAGDQVLKWSENQNDAFAAVDFDSAIKGYAVFARSAGLADKETATFSKGLVDAAGDLASFHNADPSEVLDNIKSGLTGEAEPLRKYGILLSEATVQQEAMASGIGKEGEKLTESQKILARRNLIMKSLGAAQGDWARTIDSAANQERLLAANAKDNAAALGKGLLPAYTTLIKLLQSVVTFFGKHVTLTKTLTAVVATLAALFITYSAAVKIAAAVQAVFNTVTMATNATLLANPIGLVVVAIVALVAAFIIAYKKSETFKKIVDAAFRGVLKVVKFVITVILTYFKLYLMGIQLVIKGLVKLGGWIPWIGDKVKGLEKGVGSAITGIDKLQGAVGRLGNTSKTAGGKMAKAGVDAEALSAATKKLGSSIKASSGALSKMGEAVTEAFTGFNDKALQAFDAETERVLKNLSVRVAAVGRSWLMKPGDLTPAERELAALDEAERKRDLAKRKSDALKELKDAKGAAPIEQEIGGKIITVSKGPDVERLKAAREELAAIEREQTRNRLEKRADTEREAADKAIDQAQIDYKSLRDEQKEHFEKELLQLENAIKKGELTQSQARARALATLSKYGISLEKAGKSLGDAFSRGLEAGIKSIMDQAAKTHAALLKIVELRAKLVAAGKKAIPVTVTILRPKNPDGTGDNAPTGGSRGPTTQPRIGRGPYGIPTIVGQNVEKQYVNDESTARQIGNQAAKKVVRR